MPAFICVLPAAAQYAACQIYSLGHLGVCWNAIKCMYAEKRGIVLQGVDALVWRECGAPCRHARHDETMSVYAIAGRDGDCSGQLFVWLRGKRAGRRTNRWMRREFFGDVVYVSLDGEGMLFTTWIARGVAGRSIAWLAVSARTP